MNSLIRNSIDNQSIDSQNTNIVVEDVVITGLPRLDFEDLKFDETVITRNDLMLN